MTSLNMIPPSAVVSRVPTKTKSSTRPGLASRLVCMGFRQRGWSMLHRRAHLVVCRTPDSQHGDSLTDTRTEIASAVELSALKPKSHVIVLTASRDVYEERLCVWPILGDIWMMALPGGTLVDVPINHLVALRHVTGKQTCPREPPVGDDDLRNWVRQGQEAAAVIFGREILPESNY